MHAQSVAVFTEGASGCMGLVLRCADSMPDSIPLGCHKYQETRLLTAAEVFAKSLWLFSAQYRLSSHTAVIVI